MIANKGGRPRTQKFTELQMEVEHTLRYCAKVRDTTVIERLVGIRIKYLNNNPKLSSTSHSQHWRKAIRESVSNMNQDESLVDDIVEKCKTGLISKLKKRREKHGYKARL